MRGTPRGVVALVAAVAVFAAGAGTAAGEPVTEEGPAISIRTEPLPIGDQTAEPVPAAFIGANHRWTGDGKGMWDPATGTPVGGIDRLARDVGLNLVRYPGGTVANLFDFTEAVGPMKDRGCQTSGGFADGLFEQVDSRYGPDENQKYVEAIGGRTMIMVPTIGRTAQDAANFVEYMNAKVGADPNGDGVDHAALRARNGHREPYGITIWEYGNEPYLPNQRYWRSADVAEKLQQFIHGGWQRQTADSPPYQDNDGLFSGCDLMHRVRGDGTPGQAYRVRYPPIALPEDATAESGPIADTKVSVAGEPWRRVTSFAGLGPDAKVYRIARGSGRVMFGDGVRGKVPPAGSALSVEYTSGRHDGLVDFYAAMKQVDPSISVCAGWGKSEFIAAAGTAAPYDCLGAHLYTTPAGADTMALYHDSMLKGSRPVADLVRYRGQLESLYPDPATRPYLIVTEFGTLNVGRRDFGAMLMHNLYGAELMIGQLENGVRASTVSNHNAGPPACAAPCDPEARRAHGELFGSAPKFFLNGRGHLTRMFSTLVGGTVARSGVTANPTPEGQAYPSLRMVATCDDGAVRAVVVNRDPDRAITAPVVVAGASGAREVTITTLDGPAVDALNTYEKQDVVGTGVERLTIPAPDLRHEFPAHSVTLLELIDPTGAAGCGEDG